MTDEKKPLSSEQTRTPPPPPTTEYQRRDKQSPLNKQDRGERRE